MLDHLKTYAQKRYIPIIGDDGLSLLKDLIDTHQVKKILEIGTAIGYSAIALASYGCHVDTFERDALMIKEAIHHIELSGLTERITLFPYDALTYQKPLDTYDLIFIDAAKSQYQVFFEKYTPYLKSGGVVVCDNLSFHDIGLTTNNKHTKHLMKKLERFKTYLSQVQGFHTTFHDVGDGMSVSIKDTL